MRWLIGVEPEIVQCAPADRIGVLVLRKCFAVPSYRTTGLSHSPWHAAVPLIVKRAVVCPPWFLTRPVKPNVAYVNPWCKRHTERLNAAVQVLVIQGILIMPDSSRRIGNFVAHQPDAIVSRIRLSRVHCRARPSHDGRLRPHSRAGRGKCVAVPAAEDSKPAIGGVVIHVTLARMRLAPGVFMWRHILGLGKISRASVLRRIQIAASHRYPV